MAEFPEVRSIEIRDEALIVRTSAPKRFFAELGELVVREGLEVHRLQTLDAGADAVFGYLEGGVR